MRDIFDSARFGSVDEVKRAVERGQDVNATDRSGDTPLCHAARKGHLAVSQLLLEIGAAASGAGSQGYTPLHYSATNGYGSLSQLLLENGAEIDAVDEKGRTPLFFAVKYGRSEVAALLLDSGADVGGVHVEVEGKTAIDRCTDAEVLRLLVQAADQRNHLKIAQLKKELKEQEEAAHLPRTVVENFRSLLLSHNPTQEAMRKLVKQTRQDHHSRIQSEGELFTSTMLFQESPVERSSFTLSTVQEFLLQLILSLRSIEGAQKGIEALNYLVEVEPSLRQSLEMTARCSELKDGASLFRMACNRQNEDSFAVEIARDVLRKEYFEDSVAPLKDKAETLYRLLKISSQLGVDILSYSFEDISWTGVEDTSFLSMDIRAQTKEFDLLKDSTDEALILQTLSSDPFSELPFREDHPCLIWTEYHKKLKSLRARLSLLENFRRQADTVLSENELSFDRLKKLKDEMEIHDLTGSPSFGQVVGALSQIMDEVKSGFPTPSPSSNGKSHLVFDAPNEIVFCVICCDRHRDVTYFPCAHQCSCFHCASKVLDADEKGALRDQRCLSLPPSPKFVLCPVCKQSVAMLTYSRL